MRHNPRLHTDETLHGLASHNRQCLFAPFERFDRVSRVSRKPLCAQRRNAGVVE